MPYPGSYLYDQCKKDGMTCDQSSGKCICGGQPCTMQCYSSECVPDMVAAKRELDPGGEIN